LAGASADAGYRGIADDADALATKGVDALEKRTREMVWMGHWLKRQELAKPAAADPLIPRMTSWFSSYGLLLMLTFFPALGRSDTMLRESAKASRTVLILEEDRFKLYRS
jgi:hypothetical protein